MIPDVNVVLAAARQDHANHSLAKAWWLDALQTVTFERPLRLLPVVVRGFLRVVTHPKIFRVPSTIQEATKHIDSLLLRPNVELFDAQPNWSVFRQLCVDKSLTGSAIPEA
jgi:uncharacterized protein